MIRSALLFGTVLIVAACLACAPVATFAPPASMAGAASLASGTCPDGSKYLSKVSYLARPFQPDTGLNAPTGTALPDPYGPDLVQAFDIASPTFQARLCSVDAIYVQGTACTSDEQCFGESWGWWQSTNKFHGGRLVGLSAALWSYKPAPGAPSGAYSRYETDLMNTVLPLKSARYSGAASCSSPGGCRCDSGGNCTSADIFPMALLAALAHEVGHIRWYDLVVTYDPVSKTYSAPRNICTDGSEFFSGWGQPVKGPPKWRHVLTPQQRRSDWGGPGSNWPNIHRNIPHIRDIDWSGNQEDRANKTLALLVGDQPWASVFGSISPDEDFVETYKFKVLTTARLPVKWVKITIPTLPPQDTNIADDYARGAKPSLAKKLGCIPDPF